MLAVSPLYSNSIWLSFVLVTSTKSQQHFMYSYDFNKIVIRHFKNYNLKCSWSHKFLDKKNLQKYETYLFYYYSQFKPHQITKSQNSNSRCCNYFKTFVTTVLSSLKIAALLTIVSTFQQNSGFSSENLAPLRF